MSKLVLSKGHVTTDSPISVELITQPSPPSSTDRGDHLA